MQARILKSLLLLAGASLIAAALAHWCGWPGPWAALAGAAAILATHATVLGWEFIFAGRIARTHATEPGPENSRTSEMAAPPGWERSPALRAWLGEIVASLRAFFQSQIWFGDRELPTAATARKIPVLLVHGYFCNRALWRPLAKRLAERGHPVGSVNLEPVFGSIDDYTPIVAAGIERLLASSGADRVALVGHSMGGLAARAALRQAGTDQVAGLVTLGTPHRGTLYARRALGRNAAQMRPGSEWLGALAAAEPDDGYPKVTVILTHQDNIVVPAQPQSLPGARTIAFTGLGHVELIYAPAVHQAVCAALDVLAPATG
ncbi:MAG: alpha/beta fold hydrolase [Burkholderiaceae bacterium]|nr:alpha/beta fold hydrolase [Burkholderiaceae bacterium]